MGALPQDGRPVLGTGDVSAVKLRRLTWVFFLGMAMLVACAEPTLQSLSPELEFVPSFVEVNGWTGYELHPVLELQSFGRVGTEVRLEVTGPLRPTEDMFRVEGARSRRVRLAGVVEAPGTYRSAVVASYEGRVARAEVMLRVASPPSCTAPGSCQSSTFDPGRGACVVSPLPDGSRCEETCIVDGQCGRGQCLGRQRPCGDQNLCTLDFCDPVKGCQNVDDAASCADAGPCRAGFCNPATGCGSVPVQDGTLCGELRCGGQPVCMGGACVERTPPDGVQTPYLCAVEVEAASVSTCALLVDGGVACWGLLDGEHTWWQPVAVQLPGPADKLWLGDRGACARLQADGRVFCWGDLVYHSTIAPDPWKESIIVPPEKPEAIPELHGAELLDLNFDSTCVVADGSWKCRWEPNTNYKSFTEIMKVPSGVRDMQAWALIQPDGGLILRKLTHLPGLGEEPPPEDGGCPDFSPIPPTHIPGIPPVQRVLQVFGGCAVTETQEVWCWGKSKPNYNDLEDGVCSKAPSPVPGLGTVKDFDLYWNSRCAVVPDGGVRCWGVDPLQKSTLPEEYLPRTTPVPFRRPARQVAVGYRHVCALNEDSTISCMGMNRWGELALVSPRAPDGGYIEHSMEPVDIRWDGRRLAQ